MAKKKQQNKNQTSQKGPHEFFCKYSKRYVIAGRWNWDCKCRHCGFAGICSDCQITHKALYIPEAKKYREKACKRCFLKTRQIQERIATEKQQNEKIK